jgi:hypothetical protein
MPKTDYITKEYFERTLDKKLDNFVTKEYLDKTLDTRFRDFEKRFKSSLISDLIKAERTMLHEALIESLENAKVYHQNETDKYIKVIMDEWREESRAFHDYMRGIKDTQDGHEERILKLEFSS